jgi:hypothetical protein
MIETFKDMKHGKSSSYENLALERTANQILHHMEDKDSEDSLESTRARVLCVSFEVWIPASKYLTPLQRTPGRSTVRIVF